MQFSSEEELETHCMKALAAHHIKAKRQVVVGDGRADIVTDQAVIEVKKVLDRQSIQQALGQATIYNRILNRKEIWIVGQIPADWKDLQSAYKLAAEIGEEGKLVVSFVGDDPFWDEQKSDQNTQMGTFYNWRFVTLGVNMLLVAIGVYAALSQISPSQVESRVSNPSPPPPTVDVRSPQIMQEPNSVRLSTCNGMGAANFRSSPSLNGEIIGVLLSGTQVQLTGIKAGHAIAFWQVRVGDRIGWIAQCFFGD